MPKLTSILDLIAGICMAVDFLFPKIGEPAGRWLVRQLPDKYEVLDPLHPKTIRFNVIVTFFILALIITWAVAKDTGTYTTSQLWGTIGLFAIGSAIGATLITILALALNKLGKYIHILKTGSQFYLPLLLLCSGVLTTRNFLKNSFHSINNDNRVFGLLTFLRVETIMLLNLWFAEHLSPRFGCRCSILSWKN